MEDALTAELVGLVSPSVALTRGTHSADEVDSATGAPKCFWICFAVALYRNTSSSCLPECVIKLLQLASSTVMEATTRREIVIDERMTNRQILAVDLKVSFRDAYIR